MSKSQTLLDKMDKKEKKKFFKELRKEMLHAWMGGILLLGGLLWGGYGTLKAVQWLNSQVGWIAGATAAIVVCSGLVAFVGGVVKVHEKVTGKGPAF